MNAKELMIGDWVYCEGQPTPDNVKIQSIHEDGVWFQGKEFEGAASYDRIFPIPLTPEILEKNFTRTEVRILSGTKTHYVESDDFYCVALNEYTDSIWELEYTNCEAHFPLVRVLVAHVHELQNALRLIGIDKEIVL